MRCPYCDSELQPGMPVCPACNADVASMGEAAAAEATSIDAGAGVGAASVVECASAAAAVEPVADTDLEVVTVGSPEPPASAWYAQAPASPPAVSAAPVPPRSVQQQYGSYGQPATDPYGHAQPAAVQPQPYYASVPEQPAKPGKGRTVFIAVVAALVIALAGSIGLAFANVIDIPFISGIGGSGASAKVDSNDPIAVYKQAAEKLNDATDFDMTFDAQMDFDVSSGRESESLALVLEGDLSVAGYDPDDLDELEIEGSVDGDVLEEQIALDFEYADGVMEYTLTKPVRYSGSERVDSDDLFEEEVSFDLFDSDIIKDAEIDGDTITFTVDASELLDNDLFEEGFEEGFSAAAGFDPGDLDDLDLGEWTVTVDLLDRSTGAMDVTIEGSMYLEASGLEMDIDLSINYVVKPRMS